MDLRANPQTGPAAEAVGMVAWRRARLLRAGFGDSLAEHLARECAVDLHALIELVERGCPPPLAARILAPLEPERRGC